MTTAVGIDPLALVGRVLEQVVHQLVPEEVQAGAGDTPADELLAAALGRRLAGIIGGGDDSAPQADGAETDGSAQWLTHYEELHDRNSALAGALGACDCWG